MLAGSIVCFTHLSQTPQGLRLQPHEAFHGAEISRRPWLGSLGGRHRDSSSNFQRAAIRTLPRAIAVPQPELESPPKAEAVQHQEQAVVRSLAGLDIHAIDGV